MKKTVSAVIAVCLCALLCLPFGPRIVTSKCFTVYAKQAQPVYVDEDCGSVSVDLAFGKLPKAAPRGAAANGTVCAYCGEVHPQTLKGTLLYIVHAIARFFAGVAGSLRSVFRIRPPEPVTETEVAQTDPVTEPSSGEPETDPPSGIPDYVSTAALSLAEKVKQKQTASSVTFLAASDSHWLETNQNVVNGDTHAGMAMKILAQALQPDFAAFLGDYTSSGSETAISEGLSQFNAVNVILDDAFNGLPQFRTPGNHDYLTYSYEQNGDYLTAQQLQPLVAAYNEGNVFGDPVAGYCYRDFPEKKVRVICLNTAELQELPQSNVTVEGLSPAQLKWFAETLQAVGAMGPEWSVIVLSHHPLDWGGANAASAVVNAYVNGTVISLEGTVYDFGSSNAAAFVAAFHGHTHCFKTDSLHLITEKSVQPYNAYRVAIPNMCFYRNNEYGRNGIPEYFGLEFGEENTCNKTADTANDTAFCVITVDLAAKVIYAFCYGAGYDRVISYGF